MTDRHRRIEELDIIKAIAIVFMVAGHAEAPFSHFVYLFHMAVFYIISGYLYSEKNSLTFRKFYGFVRSKLKGLCFPFFICSAVFTALNNVFLRIFIYTDNSKIFNYVARDQAVIHKYMNLREIAIATSAHYLTMIRNWVERSGF